MIKISLVAFHEQLIYGLIQKFPFTISTAHQDSLAAVFFKQRHLLMYDTSFWSKFYGEFYHAKVLECPKIVDTAFQFLWSQKDTALQHLRIQKDTAFQQLTDDMLLYNVNFSEPSFHRLQRFIFPPLSHIYSFQ